MNGKLSEESPIDAVVRLGCVISSWLFTVYIDGVLKERKAKLGYCGENMKMNENE